MPDEGLGFTLYINQYTGAAYHPDGTPLTVRYTKFIPATQKNEHVDFQLEYDHFPGGLNVDSLEVVRGLMAELSRPVGIRIEVSTLENDRFEDSRGDLTFVFKLADDGKQVGYMRAGECAFQLSKGQPGIDRLNEQLGIMVRDQRDNAG